MSPPLQLGHGLGLAKSQVIGGLDPAVAAFAATSGATDVAGLDALIRYVRGQGLWDSFVIYPMKSAQNAGSGSTVYSLGGLTTNDMTLVNSPTWGASGIEFDGLTQYGNVADFLPGGNLWVWVRYYCHTTPTSDFILADQWVPGSNQRSWRLWYDLSQTEYEITRSEDGSNTNKGKCSYNDFPTSAVEADHTLVARFPEGAELEVWEDNSAKTRAVLIPSTTRHNSTGAVIIGAGEASGVLKHAPVVVSAALFMQGVSALTTDQRETITDLTNAL